MLLMYCLKPWQSNFIVILFRPKKEEEERAAAAEREKERGRTRLTKMTLGCAYFSENLSLKSIFKKINSRESK